MKKLLLTSVAVLIVGLQLVSAQTRPIRGQVLDEKGEGVPGASVLVKGEKLGTITDLDGNFILEVPDDANILIVNAIGYGTQEVNAGDGGAAVDVKLKTTSTALTETVVTALGIKREKRQLGYGTATINSDELSQGNNTSALSALSGKTAGVNITSTTGGPGGSTRVVLRGEKSLSNGNNALIVVDGVPVLNNGRTYGKDERSQIDFGNRGNDINPDDIESITVLKGPAAAALYGEQGAQGAVMITTKSGKGRSKENRNAFSFTTSYTLSNVLKLPDFQNRYGQGDLNANPSDRRENFSWGLPFDNQLRPWGQEINGKQQVKPYAALPNNVKNFFKTGRALENNFQYGNSTETSDYFISLNTLNSSGVTPNTFYNKYSIRFNGKVDLPKGFYSSLNVAYTTINQRIEQSGQGNGSVYNSVLQTPRDIPLTELKDLNNIFNSMGSVDANGVERYGYYGAYTLNPYWVAKNYDNRLNTNRLMGNTILGFKPNKGKHFHIFNRLGVDFTNDIAKLKTPKYSYEPYDDFYKGNAHSEQGGYTEGNTNSLLINNDLIANYTTDFSKDFTFNAMLGYGMELWKTNSLTGVIDPASNGLVIPGYYNLQNAQGPVDVANSFTRYNKFSWYGSAALGYKNLLFLELTGRADWNSTLSPYYRKAITYPNASLSYVFSEQIKNKRILSYGKVRMSYAGVGTGAQPYVNNNPGYVRTKSGTGFGEVRLPFDGNAGYTAENTLGNDKLRPERTSSIEIGTELSFFDSRVSVDFTYYNQKSKDGIITVPTAPSSGYTGKVFNIGQINNNGIELGLRATPIATHGFTWEVFATYTKNNNEVKKLSEGATRVSLGGVSGMTVNAEVGKPFGAFYGTDILKNDAGQVIVDESTGMPKLTANTVYKGSYQPKFIASWGTSLKYKGFYVNVLFDTKQGGVFYSRTKDILDFVGTAKETENRKEQVFANSVIEQPDGSYKTNTTPYSPYEYFSNVIPDGQHIVDASYVKLRELAIGYKLPTSLANKYGLGSASISFYGNNLFIWTLGSNMYADPEMNSGGASNLQGFDFSSRPSLRNYGIRLGVTF